MVTKVDYPVAPTVTPLRGTVLDAATIIPEFKWLDGVALYDSFNCMTFRESAEFCAPNNKDFNLSSVWQNGYTFAVYGGVTCKPIGLDQARMKSEAQRAFLAGEAVAVEQSLMANRFVANVDIAPDPDVTYWEAPENITPAAAPSAAVGLALLEGHAAANYVGTPTIHMPRSIASLLMGTQTLVWDGDTLRTPLGSKVAAGGGYDVANSGPDGSAATAGTRWMYATGEVVIGRTEVIVRDALDHVDNDAYVLVERGYLAAIDCYAAAISVTLED